MKQLFLVVFAALLFTQCDKEKKPTTGDVKINFTSSFDQDPLVFNKVYEYLPQRFIQYTKFDMFLSSITLTGGPKGDTVLADISYLNFDPVSNDANSAKAGLVMEVKNVPVGDYTGMSLGVGVRPDINATNPTNYTSDNPLSQPELYWAGWKSYIFSRMEGKMDSVTTGLYATGMSYHTGLNDFYRVVNLTSPIKVTGGTSNTIKININIRDIFKSDDTYLDIMKITEAHGPSDKKTIEKIVNNYSHAIKIVQ
jgi:hypothetical protein